MKSSHQPLFQVRYLAVLLIAIFLVFGISLLFTQQADASNQASAKPDNQLNARCWIEFFNASPGSPVSYGTHVSLHGKGNCDGGVRAVKFLIDGQPKNEIGAPEQTETWKTEEFGSGGHDVCFTVAAWDDPNWSSATTSCKRYEVQGAPQPTQPPAVQCSIVNFSVSPQNGTAGTTISMSGEGSCNTGVRAVRFSIDGQPWGEFGGPKTSATWGATVGSHTIGFHVAGWGDDSWSRQASSFVTVTIANAPPPPPTAVPNVYCNVVSFNVSPQSASPGSTISMSGEGSCNTGVRAVRFSIDGQPWGEFGGPKTSSTWGSTQGTHTMGFHVAGWGDNSWSRQASSYVTVTIANAPPQPPTTVPDTQCKVEGFNVSPLTAATGATISMSGEGSCNTGVRAVRFSIDGQSWGEFGGPKTSSTWRSTDGTHTIGFHVAGWGDDNWSRQASSYLTVKIGASVSPPTAVPDAQCKVVNFTVSPQNAAPGINVSFSGEGSCNTGVRAVRFSINGQPWGEFGGPKTTSTWKSTEGTFRIGFHVAGWGDNNWSREAASYLTVKIGNDSPPPSTGTDVQCRIVSFSVTPQTANPGTVVTLSGEGSCTTGVRFSIDGQPWGEFGGSKTLSSWTATEGTHTIGFHVAGQGDNSWEHQTSSYRSFNSNDPEIMPQQPSPDTVTLPGYTPAIIPEPSFWENLFRIEIYASDDLCHPQCVDYVRDVWRSDAKLWSAGAGAAANWKNYAENAEEWVGIDGATYKVKVREPGEKIEVGDIVVFAANCGFALESGHVAYVESVDGENFTITDANFDNKCSKRSGFPQTRKSCMAFITKPYIYESGPVSGSDSENNNEGQQCFQGSWIDTITDQKGLHYFVAFETGMNNTNNNNWKITSKPFILFWDKILQPWASPDQFGRIEVGFRWTNLIPWEYFMKPEDFVICKE